MGTDYERELKRLLGGDMETLRRLMRTCDAFQCQGYQTMETYPFMVVRGAGSFGVDLVALRGELSFPIEVKSSIHEKLYLSKPKLKEQLEQFIIECKRANTFPIYAYRMKKVIGDPWRVFTIRIDGLRYFSRLLNERIPPIRETSGGNHVLEWEEGMPLSSFLLEVGRMLSQAVG